MRILMLGNSYIFTNDMPRMLAELTGAEIIAAVILDDSESGEM